MLNSLLVYVGTYTLGKSEGIYVYRFDVASGGLRFVSKAVGIDNPSFLAFDNQNQHLYAVNELKEFEGEPTGTVSAFSVDAGSGELSFLNKKLTHGQDPCYLMLDKTGRYVLVANYTSGSLCVLPVLDEGYLGDSVDFIQHRGSSVNQQRQEGPHAHSIVLDGANRFAYAPDLGLDKVMIYVFDEKNGQLMPNTELWFKANCGAGPRHFTFHPNGSYAYLINELDSTIVTFSYDRGSGSLKEIQTVSALPEDFSGVSTCADIHVTASGKFLYGSNRGHDSIVAFRIDQRTGKLSFLDHTSTGGQTPRNFTIDPTDRYLLVANQDSDSVVTFRIDQQTGMLIGTDEVAEIPMPVCLRMVFIQN